jgi:hypothetical protein
VPYDSLDFLGVLFDLPFFISNFENLGLFSPLVRFVRGLSILFVFSKNQLFVSWLFVFLFVCLYLFHWFGLYFFIFLLLVFFLACSFFYRSLRSNIRTFNWGLCVFLKNATMEMDFPFRTVFAVSHRFWKVVLSFSLNSRNFLFLSLFV